MSGSLGNFFEDVEDGLANIADDVENGTSNVANDVEREANDVINDVDGGTDAPSTTSNAAQVTRLYRAVLDRDPEDAGLAFWTTALRTGADLDDLATVFVASPEFQDRYGDLGPGEFVNLLYLNVLDREADPAGREFWTSGLQSGRLDEDDVVLAFSESPEFVAKVGPVSDDGLF